MGYCLSQTSLAHTYGNITCFIAEYIKGLFPPNYFRTIHISSTIAYRQFNIFQNRNKEFLKKDSPMLIIRPRVELNDSDTFLYGTFLTQRMTDNYDDIDFSNLQEFMWDKETGSCMKFLLNRLKILFDVTIIVNTQMEQLNQAHYFKNRVRQDHPFFLTTALESYIPKELMELVSKDAGVPMYDENGSVKPFLDYIQGISIYPVSYKLKNSSGNDEFFRFYPANIDTMITGLSIDDGSKRGMIADAYSITFTVSTEFNGTGLYYYFTEQRDFVDKFIADMVVGEERKIIPLFTISNLHEEKIADGWNVFASPIYYVSSNRGPDITNIESLFNYSMKQMISYHREHGIPFNTFIIPIVMKDNVMLKEGIDFSIDYEKFELVTYKVNMDSTYRLILHVNTLYINSLITDILDLANDK